MLPLHHDFKLFLLTTAVLVISANQEIRGQEPPRSTRSDHGRNGPIRSATTPCRAIVETSDGKVHPGQITLTRDTRLKIFDEQQKKHREIPLKAIKRIDCTVLKEWVEEEWRFKENASDEKYFTGRTYPSREYTHTITLQNGQKIEGTLSGIVYVRAPSAEDPDRYLLHKRDKGQPGTDLKSLVYVRSIQLGDKAVGGNPEGGQGPSPRNSDPKRKPR